MNIDLILYPAERTRLSLQDYLTRNTLQWKIIRTMFLACLSSPLEQPEVPIMVKRALILPELAPLLSYARTRYPLSAEHAHRVVVGMVAANRM